MRKIAQFVALLATVLFLSQANNLAAFGSASSGSDDVKSAPVVVKKGPAGLNITAGGTTTAVPVIVKKSPAGTQIIIKKIPTEKK
jgi:hypothetical protein